MEAATAPSVDLLGLKAGMACSPFLWVVPSQVLCFPGAHDMLVPSATCSVGTPSHAASPPHAVWGAESLLQAAEALEILQRQCSAEHAGEVDARSAPHSQGGQKRPSWTRSKPNLARRTPKARTVRVSEAQNTDVDMEKVKGGGDENPTSPSGAPPPDDAAEEQQGGAKPKRKKSEDKGTKPRLMKNKKPMYWTPEEHQKFLMGLEKFGLQTGLGPGGAELMSVYMGNRTALQIKSHFQKYLYDLAGGRTSS